MVDWIISLFGGSKLKASSADAAGTQHRSAGTQHRSAGTQHRSAGTRRYTSPDHRSAELPITSARMLTLILWLTFFVAAASILALAFPFDLDRLTGETWVLIAMSASVVVGTRFLQWMVRRGWVRLAAILFMITLWGGVTIWLWLISGISSNHLAFLYPLVVVLGSMLLGQSGTWAFTALSIIGLVGAHTAERSGQLPVTLSLTMPEDLVAMSLVLVLLTIVLIRGRRSLTVAVEAAQQAAMESERASRQLETIQTSLEQRVAYRTRELSISGTALQAAADIGRAAAAQETEHALISEAASMIAEQFTCYHVGIYLFADVDDAGERHRSAGERHRSADSHHGAADGGQRPSTDTDGARDDGGHRAGYVVLRARGGGSGDGVPSLGYEVYMGDGGVIAEAIEDGAMKLALGANVPRTAFSFSQTLSVDITGPADAGTQHRVTAMSNHRARLPETVVEIVLPLAVGSMPVGAIDMHISDMGAFYPQSLDPLQIMADQVAVAITSARRLQQSRLALQAERDAYRQISQEGWLQLLRSGGVPGYQYRNHRVEPIPVDTTEVVGMAADNAWYPEMRAALAQGTRIVTGPVKKTGAPMDVNGDDAGRSQASGSTRSPDDDSEPPVGRSVEDHRGAVAALPIRVRDQSIGVLHIRKRRGAGDWNARELELLDSLTAQLEVALESARLYRETQEAAIQQQTIAEVGAHIREEVDIEAVLARALEELGSALAADRGSAVLTLPVDIVGQQHRSADGQHPIGEDAGEEVV